MAINPMIAKEYNISLVLLFTILLLVFLENLNSILGSLTRTNLSDNDARFNERGAIRACRQV